MIYRRFATQRWQDTALHGCPAGWPAEKYSRETHPLLKQAPDVRFDVHAVWQQTPHLPLRVRIAIDTLASRLPSVLSLDMPEPKSRAKCAA